MFMLWLDLKSGTASIPISAIGEVKQYEQIVSI